MLYYSSGKIYLEGIDEDFAKINRGGNPKKLWDFGLHHSLLKVPVKKALGKTYDGASYSKQINEHRNTIAMNICKTAKKYKLGISEDFVKNHFLKADVEYVWLAKA